MASIPIAIPIVQLALKHRQNKNLRQCVTVFDASPDVELTLVRLVKKNNIALDVIAFGDGTEQAGEGAASPILLSRMCSRSTTRTFPIPSFIFYPYAS